MVLFNNAREATAVLLRAVLNKNAAVPIPAFSSPIFRTNVPASIPVLKLPVVML